MKILSLSNLNSDINKKILNERWLNSLNLTPNFVLKYIQNDDYIKTLKDIVDSKNFSYQKCFELCKPLLNSMNPNFNDKQWINYIYYYSLNKSFPNAVNIKFNSTNNKACNFFFTIFSIMSEYEKYSQNGTWQGKYPLIFLSNKEIKELERPDEYKTFIKAFKYENIYEMMKINRELFSFNTIDHICGVHYLALYIARQLKNLGIPIDLGRISGAAAGHDIGKYGCCGNELKNVPRLHYYYTDLWFKKHNINYIRNIAINHSTWDLGLENLSLESLILIYCDFRVKNIQNNGKNEMNIFSLYESFNVIMNKLENLDYKKEKRYKKVYSKLKDFEKFLIDKNININIEYHLKNTKSPIKKYYSLMNGEEVVTNLKLLSIEHNIKLMYKLRDEYSSLKILETARSQKNWKKLRQYIIAFKEYSTYLTKNQKIQTLRFLYENLIYSEDDIRKNSAKMIGFLIATSDEKYRKELPSNVILSNTTSNELLKEYMNLFLYPSRKLISKHREWIRHSTYIMVKSLFSNCNKSVLDSYRNIILSYYNKNNIKNCEIKLSLLEIASYIPIVPYNKNLEILFDFILSNLDNKNASIKLYALETLYNIILKISNLNYESNIIEKAKSYLKQYNFTSKIPTENLLLYKLSTLLNIDIDKFNYINNISYKKISKIFLNNLKSATNWINKKGQIELLLNYAKNNIKSEGLHTCLHFCNLLKVSDVEDVRGKAGSSILELINYINQAEINEVCVELLRALEIEGSRFTEYIPQFLGKIILYLEPNELNELITDFSLKIKQSKPNIKTLILKTLGIAIANYSEYKNRFKQKDSEYQKRLLLMLGIIVNGIADYETTVKQSALTILGTDIFGSKYITLKNKNNIFKLTAKKILTLIEQNNDNELLFLTTSIALNNIYRFISDYTFTYGKMDLPIPKKIAFFPGTFDPFSSSHKKICKQIIDLGYEVYLSIDEFSWSKRTLPNLLRKNIVNMSISDIFNIYIYPDSIQINISNYNNLEKLKNSFPNSEVYIVIGSDVLLNASSYKKDSENQSIHNFPHIIIERGDNKSIKKLHNKINNKIEIVKLPEKYKRISSTQIRNCIDKNRDISTLVDPLAQQYIYEYGLYQREPQEKHLVHHYSIDTEIIGNLNDNLVNDLIALCPLSKDKLVTYLKDLFVKKSSKIILLRDSYSKKALAFSSFYYLDSNMFFKQTNNINLCEYLRENTFGRIVMIDNMFIVNKHKDNYIEQILITETLSYCLSKDYEFAIYKNVFNELFQNNIYELLKLQGFIEIHSNNKIPELIVNMSNPCSLNIDIYNVIKKPFRNNHKVKKSIYLSRKHLQKALTKLYPGELILSFDCNMTFRHIINKICIENNVFTNSLKLNQLGPSMCVPYGDFLDRFIIPNTVTKSLHTEKFFYPDMSKFFIGEFPYYLSLKNQSKMIKSFNRNVILVDNLLHKGHRLKALLPLFKNQKINIQKIIVGIMSGKGKDLADVKNFNVDCVYFIPRLKLWFNESSLYPFIGGDAVYYENFPIKNLIPSLNSILPYTYPSFIKNTSVQSIYNLSKICIENSLNIITSLEEEFHMLEKKDLTLSYLGEVLTIPRCPDRGKYLKYNLNINASHYLKNDLESLKRYISITNNK